MIEVSFIIVNTNTGKYVRDCIVSITRYCSDIQYEIIVVDNDSVPVDHEYFIHLPQVRFHEMNYNSGFCRSNNVGMRTAKGTFIILLNPDTLLIDDSIQRCINFFEENKNNRIGILGCKLLKEDLGTCQWYQWNMGTLQKTIQRNPFFTFFFSYTIRRQTQKWNEQLNKTIEVPWVSGAFVMMKRETMCQHHLFLDEDIFLYFDDMDLGARTRSRGLKVIYFPDAKIIHLGNKSEVPPEKAFCQSTISGWLFMMKKEGRAYFLINQFVEFLNITMDSLLCFRNQLLERLSEPDRNEVYWRRLRWKMWHKYTLRILFCFHRKPSLSDKMLIAKY